MKSNKACGPHLVIFALRSAGCSQSDIAEQLKRSLATVCSVVHGRARSRYVETRISRVTGVPLHQLWPQWYGPDDTPIKKRKRYGNFLDAAARLKAIDDAQRMVA